MLSKLKEMLGYGYCQENTWDMEKYFPLFEWLSRLSPSQQKKALPLVEPGLPTFKEDAGKEHYRIYLTAISKTCPNLVWSTVRSDDLLSTEKYNAECERLLHGRPRDITPSDLDMLWCLFYGTHDIAYANRVQYLANADDTEVLTKSAASWSYQSHLNGGRLTQNPPQSILDLCV
jgi:hypothetical protein